MMDINEKGGTMHFKEAQKFIDQSSVCLEYKEFAREVLEVLEGGKPVLQQLCAVGLELTTPHAGEVVRLHAKDVPGGLILSVMKNGTISGFRGVSSGHGCQLDENGCVKVEDTGN